MEKQQTSSEYGISQELLVMSILNNYGIISIPYGNAARYDCILDIFGKIYKIQIKSLNLINNDTISVPMSNSRMCSEGNVKKSYTKDEVDYICICYQNKLYLFNPDLARTSLTVRITKPKLNNQHWLEDYNIDKVFNIQIKSWETLKEENRQNHSGAIEKKYQCIDCGIPVVKKDTRCINCYRMMQSAKSQKPTREILKEKIKNTPFTTIGKEYNVTDNAIRKWCKSYNLPNRVKDIKEIIEKGEWDNI